jgi:hemolysin activation/secretion protein
MKRIPAIAAGLLALPNVATAQVARDAASALGRDVAAAARDDRAASAQIDVKGPEASGPSASDGASVFVGAVSIDGGAEIPRDALAPAFEGFVGKQADAAMLQAMARAIADRARAQGYLFASAMVPQQAVETGTVTVQLDAGRIDAVRVVGSKSGRLQRTLNLIVGQAVRREDFERQLLVAGDIPGIEIVSTRYAREGGQAILIVEAVEDRVRGSATVDNFGPDSLGPLRTRLRVDLSGLIGDDVLTVQAVNTTMNPRELAYGSVRYTTAVGDAGTQAGVAVAAGGTQPGGAGRRLTGKSRYAAAFASHPIVRGSRASLWANAEMAWLTVDQKFDGQRVQHDELVTLTLSATGNAKLAGGWLSGAIGAVQGIGLDGTTVVGDPQASRPDGSARFTKGFFWLDWARELGGGRSVRLGANGQLADRPLLAAQEIGLGGPGSARGYDFSERFGDNGLLGAVELRQRFKRPLRFVDWVQFYGFADGGQVWNLDQGFGSGALFSGGGGLRGAIGRSEFSIEAAYPFSGPRYDSGNREPRINVSLGYRF